MASSATQSSEQIDKITLRVMVDKVRKKVVYAEAGKDFVDVLFSFFTLPLGTIARLVGKESNMEAVKFGSISSLYQSVSDLDQQYIWSQICNEMLLKPRNSMACYIKNIKLNIDDTERVKSYFLCENNNCKVENKRCLSLYRNQICICGKLLNRETWPNLWNENGFVKETLTFIVSDNLNVMPNVVGTSLYLLQKYGINDINAIDKQIVNISKREVFDIPLGRVLHVLQGFSFLSCVDNLYKSMTGFSPDRCFLSEEVKDKLTSSFLARHHGIRNQILPLRKNRKSDFYKYVDPKSPISGGFTRGPVTFMVTDDLVVRPMSSISIVSYLERMKVPLNDVEERVIMIDRKEGLSILKASLTTTSALTNGLNLCIMEQLMNEKRFQSYHKRPKLETTETN